MAPVSVNLANICTFYAPKWSSTGTLISGKLGLQMEALTIFHYVYGGPGWRMSKSII